MSSRLIASSGGSISTATHVCLAIRPHPFDLRRELVVMPAGHSIGEIIAAGKPDPISLGYLQVSLHGHLIPREHWHRVYPKAGMILEAVPLPQGGNPTLMRTILTIAIVAGAMALGAWIAGPALLGGSAILGSAGFTFASAGIGGALTLGGMLALNALIPPPTQGQQTSDVASSQTYSIEGASNAATIFAPVPLVLGRHRYTPRLAAPWRTQLDGDDEYLFGLLCWGYGPASVTDIKIGETPIERFQGVTLEHYFGDQLTSPTFANYPNQFVQASVGALLSSGVRHVRATDTDTLVAVLEFQFRRGAIKYSASTGDALGVEVSLAYRYRLVGAVPWSADVPFGMAGKQASPKRRAIWVALPGAGTYEFEVRRISGNAANDSTIDAVHWEGIQSIAAGSPVVGVQGMVFTSVKIKATDQLNGVIRDLSGTVQAYGAAWNGAAWIYGPTRNPAALFRRLLQGTSIRKPVPDDRLDLAQLQHWSDYCTANGLTCDYVFDREMSVIEALRIICACGHARPTRAGGPWSVVIDEPKAFPTQLFTARNMRDFRARRIFAREPHALRVRFTDETQGWSTQQRIVYHDGYDASNATEFEETEFPGVTHPDAIWRLARRRLAEGRLRAEAFTWTCDFEHLVSTVGDMVAVQHGAILIGRSTGRIKEVIESGGYVTGFVLDEAVVFDDAGDFVIRARRSDNSQVLLDITEPFGETREVALTTPQAQPLYIFPGDLYAIGVRDRETEQVLIRAIEPAGDLSARIIAVPYAPGVQTAHLGTIPAWDPLITAGAGQEAPIIRGLVSGDAAAVRNPDGSLTVRVLLLLWDDGSRPLATLSRIEVAWKRLDDTSAFAIIPAPADAAEVTLLGLPYGTTVRINTRYVYSTGRLGKWGTEAQYFVEGPRLPPLSPFNLIFDGAQLRWNFAPGPDHRGFLVRWSNIPGVAWEDAEGVNDTVLTEYFVDAGEFPVGTRYLLVKAVTVHGVESEQPGTLAATVTEAQQRALLEEIDLRELTWPGRVFNGEIVAGDIRALDTSVWLAGGQWLIPPEKPWLEPVWAELVYIANVPMAASYLPTDRMRLDLDLQGSYRIAYRWGTNDVTLNPFGEPVPDDILLGDFSQPLGTSVNEDALLVWRAWRQGVVPIPSQPLQIRITIAGGGALQPIIRGMRVTIDAAEVEEVFGAIAIPVEGVVLPRQKSYRVVRYIVGNLHAGGAGRSLVIDSKSTITPSVHIIDAAGQAVAGVADVRLGGA